MTEKLIDLTLPEWGFISEGGTPDPWQGRDVLLHVRSMTVFEFFPDGDVVLNGGVPSMRFDRVNTATGEREKWVCSVHLSAVLDIREDREMLGSITGKAVGFFKEYLTGIEKETLDDLENERRMLNN